MPSLDKVRDEIERLVDHLDDLRRADREKALAHLHETLSEQGWATSGTRGRDDDQDDDEDDDEDEDDDHGGMPGIGHLIEGVADLLF